MFLLQMLLIIAKVVEIAVITAIILIGTVIAWDLSEEWRTDRRTIRALRRREYRLSLMNEEINKRADEQLRVWKKQEAQKGFFDDEGLDEKFHSNFDREGRLINMEWYIPTEQSRAYLAEMKKLDDDITMNTFIEGAV